MVGKPEEKPGKKKAGEKKSVKKSPVKPPRKPAQTVSPDGETVAVERNMAAAEKSSGAAGLLWILALLAIVIGGGYATLPLWKAYIPGFAETAAAVSGRNDQGPNGGAIRDLELERGVLEGKLSALIDRLGSLERQLGDVRRMVEATGLPSEVADTNKSLQRLSGRLMKLEQRNKAAGTVVDRLDRLEKEVSKVTRAATLPATVTASIGKISKRLKRLETAGEKRRRLTAQQSKARALVLAVGQLRQTLRSGAPYSLALQTLIRLGGDAPQIAKAAGILKAQAAAGAPTLESLIADYGAVSAKITADRPGAAGGFIDQTLNRLKSLVRIRRVDDGGKSPVPVGDLTDKAGQALRDGDLQAAVNVLEGLNDPSPDVRAWIKRARSRLAAERALATLNVYAVSLLTPATE